MAYENSINILRDINLKSMKAIKTILLLVLFSIVFSLAANLRGEIFKMQNYKNQDSSDRQLIVITAPSAQDKYYRDVYQPIIDFDIAYAKSIINKDNVVVWGDKQALKLLKKELSKDILLEGTMGDIWMRDFTTVNPHQPIQFRYAAAAQGGNQYEADWVQSEFNKFASKLDIQYPKTNLILDGGNLVDNHQDKVIVTERFLVDNNLTKTEAKTKLRNLLNVNEVAIIPSDDPQ